jgi:glycosyltransferase involved in cell wall biosynthesis
MYKISIIISTWRRSKLLRQLLAALTEQSLSNSLFEVLVIDSHSGDATDEVVENFSKNTLLNVHLIQCQINSISSKRNLGIDTAIGEFIIFLDDDCIPDQDHLEKFLKAAQEFKGQNIAWCGGVRFNEGLVSTSNYYRYRNSCHFSRKNTRFIDLSFNEVVTMNMMIELEVLKKNELRFNELFLGYGCEDLEFGWGMVQKGFSIKPCEAEIQHEELNGSILKFKEKLYRASRDGFAVLSLVAPEVVGKLGATATLENCKKNNNCIVNFKNLLILKLLDSNIPALVQKILFDLDRFKFLYSRLAYRFVLAAAHRRGFHDRKSISQVNVEDANEKGWYS